MGIAHCLMPQNWHELGDVLQLAESLECRVFVNTVVSPLENSLFALPIDDLNAVVARLEAVNAEIGGRLRLNRDVKTQQIAILQNDLRERSKGTTAASLEEAFPEQGGRVQRLAPHQPRAETARREAV